MRPKYKTTGCFRFFIFFLFFIPAVYFGATYFRGENGLQKIKDFYHKIVGKASTSSSGNGEEPDTYGMEDCKMELKKVQDEKTETTSGFVFRSHENLDLFKRVKYNPNSYSPAFLDFSDLFIDEVTVRVPLFSGLVG